MKILLLSDSHFHCISTFDFSEYNYIIHCGDMSEDDQNILDAFGGIYVSGNCDFFQAPERIIMIKNKRILITHSNRYHTRLGYEGLKKHALENEVDIVFFGHTHDRCFFEDNGIIYINPGDYASGSYVIIDDESITFYDESTTMYDEPIVNKVITKNIFGE